MEPLKKRRLVYNGVRSTASTGYAASAFGGAVAADQSHARCSPYAAPDMREAGVPTAGNRRAETADPFPAVKAGAGQDSATLLSK